EVGVVGVVDGRDDLLHVVGYEAGVVRLRLLLPGLPVPDDFDAVSAQLRPLGGWQVVLALRQRRLNGRSAGRFALGQEENATAGDRPAVEGHGPLHAGALA